MDQLVQIGQSALVPSAGPSTRGSHRLSTWMDCPQKFAYRFILKLIPKIDKKGLAIGSLVHIGLMNWHLVLLGKSEIDPVAAMKCAPDRIAWQLPTALKVFGAYKQHEAIPGEVLDVEREFYVTAGGQLHTQRFDLTVASEGKVYVWDHKTSGQPPNFKSWESSLQMVSAHLVGSATFQDVYDMPFGGVVVQHISTRDVGEIQRKLLDIKPNFLQAAPQTIEEINRQIDEVEASGRDPWNYVRTNKCWAPYECDYLPLCENGRSAASEYVVGE